MGNLERLAKYRPEAAANATAAKQARARLKAGVKAGSISLAAALETPVEAIGDMPLYELIQACPRISKARLAIIGDRAIKVRINLFMPIVVLTHRDRSAIVLLMSDAMCYNPFEVSA